MAYSKLLHEINEMILRGGATREIALAKSRAKAPEFMQKVRDGTVTEDDFNHLFEDMRIWLLGAIDKFDETRLAMVKSAFLYCYGDVPESGEAFRDAMIEVKLNGIENSNLLDILDRKNYLYGITYKRITKRINDIENKNLSISSWNMNRNLICGYGNTCNKDDCTFIHNDRWSPALARKNKNKFKARNQRDKNDYDKKRNKKGN